MMLDWWWQGKSQPWLTNNGGKVKHSVDNTSDSEGKHTGQSKGADNTSDAEGQRTGKSRRGDYTSDSEGELTSQDVWIIPLTRRVNTQANRKVRIIPPTRRVNAQENQDVGIIPLTRRVNSQSDLGDMRRRKKKSIRGVDKSPDAEHRGWSKRPKVYEISESESEISHKRHRSTSWLTNGGKAKANNNGTEWDLGTLHSTIYLPLRVPDQTQEPLGNSKVESQCTQ